ncbi:ATP-dependent sacrificial sulfur transferase LarE [Streptomyces sp. AC536]|uniref:asparagine synthase-related protein n=1 Tax=Streptomyces buecherae TaxID=2763006 RepID=UPI00164EC6B8|nr:ATP-dependent sacrificial sulfur transferase LarE [Streptomyces buecherae]MBC3984588.1 ATP-dependent sacrificial sulfur transferase LarE [Streptomyces buecherae]QNJ43739.1 ATP-dependent sacrificial sulfur transferase LarE [Streptomyces buecherae]
MARKSTTLGERENESESEQRTGRVPDSSALLSTLSAHAPLAVAFSGGVDSAVVLAAAVRTWGRTGTLAVVADSPALARDELYGARRTAAEIGAELVVVATDEWTVPGYRENSGDRCYFCKRTVLARVAEVAAERGFHGVATGTHRDDRRAAHRPGLRAAAELGVAEPLADAGLGKREVRAVAAAWGLSVAEKPGTPCLSSRVAVGVPVTRERLALVERAEELVRAEPAAGRVPVTDVRVRLLAADFRIELGPPAYDWLGGRPERAGALLRRVAAATRLGPGTVARYRSGAVSTGPGPAAGPGPGPGRGQCRTGRAGPLVPRPVGPRGDGASRAVVEGAS